MAVVDGANKDSMSCCDLINPVVKCYKKKPVIIKAYQTPVEMDIPTLEGVMHASVGDYIITGVRGEQYPCKPHIFKETYDLVEGE